MSTFKWGTVTAVSPLRVMLDGDSAALPFEPDSLVDPVGLAVDDRVRVELSSRRVIIVGRSNGLVLSADAITSGTLPTTRGGTGVAAASLSALKAALGIPFAETGGVTPSSGAAGGSQAPVYWDGGTTIVLPVGMFSVAPNVRSDVAAGGSVMWSSVSTVSATSFSVRLHRINAAPPSAMSINWTARQGTAGGVTG